MTARSRQAATGRTNDKDTDCAPAKPFCSPTLAIHLADPTCTTSADDHILYLVLVSKVCGRCGCSRVWSQWTTYVEAGEFFELDRYLLDAERFEDVDTEFIDPAAVVELLTRPDMPSLVLYHGQLMPKSEAIVLFR